MGFIIRVAVSIALLALVVVPVFANFNFQYNMVPDIPHFTNLFNTFLTMLSSFFQNVHGLINYVLYLGGGQASIAVFNGLIKVGIMFPLFAFAERLAMAIFYFIV